MRYWGTLIITNVYYFHLSAAVFHDIHMELLIDNICRVWYSDNILKLNDFKMEIIIKPLTTKFNDPPLKSGIISITRNLWQINRMKLWSMLTVAVNVMESPTRWLRGFIFRTDFEITRDSSYESCSQDYFYICRQQINVRKCSTKASCVFELMAICWKGVESCQQYTAPLLTFGAKAKDKYGTLKQFTTYW